MTQEALKLALEALKKNVHELIAENKALKEALAQEQEPVKYSDYEPDGVHHNKPEQEPVACAECERLKDALKRANGLAEHFERAWYLRGDEIEELQAPMQEPVAIPDCGEAGHADGACGNRECLPSFRHSTTPPQRTWVGLTKEQLATTDWSADFRAGALWAEAKLKEKNT
jgi:hypothetical protein